MPTIVHFIDVGQGNMVLIQADDGTNFVFDCNITDENEDYVLRYVADQIGLGARIDAFICSHRDADHMRGVKKLHAEFPIGQIWDSDYPGTTTDSREYIEYMALRDALNARVIEKRTGFNFGRSRFIMLSAKDSRLPDEANAQGIVIKLEHKADKGKFSSSVILPGDSDAKTWRHGILQDYSTADVHSSILMAAHHGSSSFFDDPTDQYYYKSHLNAIKPAMTVISVGSGNSHGHPDSTALKFYREGSTGGDNGDKIYRTDKHGNIKLILKDDGSWHMYAHQ